MRSMKTALSFFGKGNWLSKFLTIILAAVSFTCFALSSMGYTYSDAEFMAVGFKGKLENKRYLVFKGISTSSFGVTAYRELITEELGRDFFSIPKGLELRATWYITAHDTEPSEDSKLEQFLLHTIVCGTEGMYREKGYPLVAGHYPEDESETVISKTLFEAFRDRGYSDNSTHFEPREAYCSFDYSAEYAPKEDIRTYEDMIGKKLAGTTRTEVLTFTIVGVYDDSIVHEEVMNKTAEAIMLLSEKFVENVCKEEPDERLDEYIGPFIERMFTPVTEDMLTLRFSRKVVKLSLEMERLSREKWGWINEGELGAEGFYQERDSLRLLAMLHQESAGDRVPLDKIKPIVPYVSKIMIIIGSMMLVIAIILSANFITDMMYRKRQQIAILRALGYKKRQVIKILVVAVMILSLIIFLASLLLTIALYYGWVLKSFGTVLQYKMFIFSGWTVLILLGISIAVPVLSAIVPILLFFRKPIAENLKRRE